MVAPRAPPCVDSRALTFVTLWLCDLTHPPHPPLAAAQEAELAFGAAGAPPEAQLVRPPITPAQMTPFDSPEEEPRMPMEAAMSDVSEWLGEQEEAELIALVLRELEEASQAELEEHEEAELEELRAAAEEFDKLELGTDGMECPCCRSGVVRADGGETVACDHCDLGVCVGGVGGDVGGVGGDGGSHSSGEGALDVLRARLGASLGAHSATGCTAAPAFALHRRAGAVTLQLVCGECGFATEAFTAPAAGSSAAG